MAYRVDISLSALQDAEDAYLWIMRRAPSQAGAWYEGLLKAIYGLEQNPTRCPMESEDVGILSFLTTLSRRTPERLPQQ